MERLSLAVNRIRHEQYIGSVSPKWVRKPLKEGEMNKLFAMAVCALVQAACVGSTYGSKTRVDLSDPAVRKSEQAILSRRWAEVFAVEKRVNAIAWPMRKAFAGMCKNRSVQHGYMGMTLREYEQTRRALVLPHRHGHTIQYVMPDGPADSAGLKAGDVVLQEMPVPNNETAFSVLRGIDSITVHVPRWYVCSPYVIIVESDTRNAATDGRNVYLTTSMVEWLGSDEKLAAVIAHEYGHIAGDHVAKKKRNATLGAVLGSVVGSVAGAAIGCPVCDFGGTDAGLAAGHAAFSQEFELEADYLGMYLGYNAGFPLSAWETLFIDLGAETGVGYGTTHPTNPERHIHVANTVREIDERSGGFVSRPLLPIKR